ncbi:MAG: ABC transporter permease subunit [Ruminiclostridium sp.]|nr:ABC transporter permease subunit [Ruminiclostridium sp.]
MRRNTKKVDFIIIAVIMLLIAGGIMVALVSSENEASGKHEYMSLDDLKDKNIGVMIGSVYESFIEKNMPDTKISFFEKASDMVAAVSAGKIDGFASSDVQAERLIEENTGLKILSGSSAKTDVAFAFPKTDKGGALRDEFNEFLSGISSDGTLEALLNKWLSSGGSHTMDIPELSGRNGTLRMATTGTYEPYTYITDGKKVGLDIELAYSFCEKYGYGLEIEIMDFGALIPALASSTYDFAGANITVTEERAESVYFSDSYTSNYIAFVVKGNSTVTENTPLSYFGDKKIGILTGSAYEPVAQKVFPDAEYMYFDVSSDLALAAVSGKIDGYLMATDQAETMIAENPDLFWLKEAAEDTAYAFAFPKTENGAVLRDKINAFLKKIKADGTMDVLLKKWTEGEIEQSVDLTGFTGENGVLSIACDGTTPPWEYTYNGEVTGYEIELVAMFCREYGYTPDFDTMTFSAVIPGISAEKYDMAAANISVTAERAESVYFSDKESGSTVVFVTAAVGAESPQNAGSVGFLDSIVSSFEKNFIREDRWKLILEGIGTTCFITVMSALMGSVLAFLVCMFRRTGSRLANAISNIYVKLLQGTPVVVLLMILYYVILGKSGLEAVWVAIIGFTLNFGAYASEIMRSGIESIDGGQREAALALGYNENQAFFKFIFPQAAVRFIPVYKQEIVSLLKSTSIVGYIAIQDLTKMSDIIRSRTYEAFFPLIATAVIYFILAWVISLILKVVLIGFDKRKRAAK